MEHQDRRLLITDAIAKEVNFENEPNPLLHEKMQQHLSIIRQELSDKYPTSLKQALSQRRIALNRKKLSNLSNEEEHYEEA
ncbi:hypothetical protein [Sutcliffiella halmapala]|uniref:hypothetical protein n=1 Tax=Sutcliffiella halmapala TaxID=79882 RepID=UPI0009951E82|nr:hypothetical protein [Sutcliffiella halmapala]